MTTRYLFILALLQSAYSFAQPVNDRCSDVSPVSLAIGDELILTGTRTGATNTEDGVAGNVLVTTPGVASVWHAFTTSACSNVTALFCNTPLPATTMWNFITPDCPADERITFSYANFGIQCTNGQYAIQWFNLPAGTYYLPIYATASGGAYELQLSAAACIPGPPNDDCAGATTLAVNTTCVTTPGSVANGTLSFAANACGGFTGDANDDVWFSFVATGSAHGITVDGDGDLDLVIELLEGTCGGLSPLACADATLEGGTEQINVNSLVEGNTYYVRVFHYYTSFAYDPAFTICVTGDVGTSIQRPAGTDHLIMPNPAQDRVLIARSHGGPAQVELMDITGRIVRSERMAQQLALDVADLPRGCYFITVIAAGERYSERLILR